MGFAAYESSRIVFEQISRKYRDYLKLYAFFNEGSTKGATPFAEFYWRYTWKAKYLETAIITDRGV